MITAVVNTTARKGFTVLDADGEPVEDLTGFTGVAEYSADTSITEDLAFVESANQAGRYYWSFTPSAGSDFEEWYVTWSVSVDGETVRYEDTVQVITAAQADPAGELTDAITDLTAETATFRDAIADLSSTDVTIESPLSITGDITLIAGDAAPLSWQSSGWDDLTSATVTFQAYKLISDTAVFDTPKAVTKTSVGGASQTVTLSLLSTDTDDFTPGIAYRYEVDSTAGTLASGKLSARGS